MKRNPPNFSRRYRTALQAHLAGAPASSPEAARALGRAVLAAGCDTLDRAELHEAALLALAPSHDFARARNGLRRHAGIFFAAALEPLEQIHRTTYESLQQLPRREETLRLHTAALAATNRLLRGEIVRRKVGEAAVRKAKERYRLLFVHSRRMQTKLRHMARQVPSAQEAERRQISRELHDEVVQAVVGIDVQLAALGSAAAIGNQALKSRIALTQRLVEKSVNAVHQVARELRPAVLDDLGLIPALHAYMKTVVARQKLKIRLTAVARVERLEKSRRTVFYRVAQGALTNVVRHAQATRVDMTISKIPGAIRMEVHDDGKSFPVEQTFAPNANRRLGLLGMRERVEMVGGSLAIESASGRGTTVRADIPFRLGGTP